MSVASSKQLLARYCQGETAAANEIYDRYVLRLLALVRRRLSPQLRRRVAEEDIVQSAMRSFFVRAANEKYVLRRAGDLWTLLAAMALSKLRRQVEIHTAAKRSFNSERSLADDVAPSQGGRHAPLPDDAAALLDEVEFVMRRLSHTEREILQMRLSGETVESIATSMGRSQRTVRRLLQNARDRLEQRLLREGQ